MKGKNFIEEAMSKMGGEFPECPRVHADWEFTLVDKATKTVQNTKKFRVVSIQDLEKNCQHVAVIIPQLSNEYVQLPQMVKEFLSQLSTREGLGGGAENDTMQGFPGIVFTKTVYLYTDKLLISKDAVQKHFEKNGMTLHVRMYKQDSF